MESRKAITENDINQIYAAMKIYKTKDFLCMYGYWNKDECVGGAYLEKAFPHNLVMEFYTRSPIVLKAIWESFVEMLKIRNQLNAVIDISNRKSLKIAKMLGFIKVYTDNNQVNLQFKPDNWRYNKRYNLKD